MTSTTTRVTSLDHRDVMRRQAGDVIAAGERALLGDVARQRAAWRHDVTACQRHVTQLSAHVSRLTSGDTWRRLRISELPGLSLFY